jgi:hypothetical protein
MRLTALSLLLLSTFLMSGCVSTSATDDLQCTWSKPLTWSSRDTEETRKEIFAHNVKWETYCQ